MPTISFLLHPGLVVFFYLLSDCFVQRLYVEELLVAQFCIYPAVNQFNLVFYQCFVFWFSNIESTFKPVFYEVFRASTSSSYLLLGSASPTLLRSAGETLAGRIEFVDLHGFDITETGRDSILQNWVRGGFPRSFLAADDEDSYRWREGFIRTFLQRDLPQFGIQVPEPTMRRFWTMLSHTHGQVLNSSGLGRSMGMTDKTIRQYVDHLEQTYMVRVLPPWFENLKKRQVKAPKVYLRDSGILHTLQSVSSQYS